jgi:hypothetical protein
VHPRGPNTKPQLLRYVLGDLALEAEHVAKLAAVASTPDVAAIPHVGEFDAEGEVVAELSDAPGQHGPHAQRLPHRLRISQFTLEAEGGRTGDDLQVGKLREIVDETLRYTVAEVIVGRVRAVVGKRQHGERVNRRAATTEVSPPGEQRQQRCGGANRPQPVRSAPIENRDIAGTGPPWTTNPHRLQLSPVWCGLSQFLQSSISARSVSPSTNSLTM